MHGSKREITKLGKGRLQDASGILAVQKSIKNVADTLGISDASPSARFNDRLYAPYADFLIRTVSIDWLCSFSTSQREDLFDPFFLSVPAKSGVLALLSAAPHIQHSFAISTINRLLVKIVSNDGVAAICEELSDAAPSPMDRAQMIKLLVSLPDRVANLNSGLPTDVDILTREKFYLLAVSQAASLGWSKLTGEHCTNVFDSKSRAVFNVISELFEKVAICGEQKAVAESLLDVLAAANRGGQVDKATMFLQHTLSFSGIALERIVESLLLTADVPIRSQSLVKTFGPLLGRSDNAALRFVIGEKLTLSRSFQSYPHIPEVLVALLQVGENSCEGTSPYRPLKELIIQLMHLWADPSSLTAVEFTIHEYRARLLLVALGHLETSQISSLRESLLQITLRGISNYLGSPLVEMRTLGQAIAEILTSIADNNHILKFEYQHTPQTKQLVDIWNESRKLGPNEYSFSSLEKCQPDVTDTTLTSSNQTRTCDDDDTDDEDDPDSFFFDSKHADFDRVYTSPSNIKSEGIDSDDEDNSEDDEFQPYQMPDDSTNPKDVQTPRYIRDCMRGLMSKDDPGRVDASLKAATTLIKSHPADLEEIAADFAATLLHIGDDFHLDGFTINRWGALVALVVECPKLAGGYLANQFYQRDWALRHRAEILEILAEASSLLSKVSIPETPIKNSDISFGDTEISTEDVKRREEVEKLIKLRLEKKTRYFGSSLHRPPKVDQSVTNKFAEFVSEYFYPLINGIDVPRVFLDLQGRDSMLLASLLKTLAVIINSAGASPIVPNLVEAFGEVLLVHRNHVEAHVRRSVAYGIFVVFKVMPTYSLLHESGPITNEARLWLNFIMRNDPDEQCRQLSYAALATLHDKMKSTTANSNYLYP